MRAERVLRANCVLDKGLLELIPIAASIREGTETKFDRAMMKLTRTSRAMEFLYTLGYETVALPACWRRDMINHEMIMYPGEVNTGDLGMDARRAAMDSMVHELLDLHLKIESYISIEEFPFSPGMVEKLKELYFYLPVAYFTNELLTTYQYAAFAWELGLPFYTDNVQFCAAINPEIARDHVLYEPIPERRLMYQNGCLTENDLTSKLSWVNLVADASEGMDDF